MPEQVVAPGQGKTTRTPTPLYRCSIVEPLQKNPSSPPVNPTKSDEPCHKETWILVTLASWQSYWKGLLRPRDLN
jgi:hypothetical protein